MPGATTRIGIVYPEGVDAPDVNGDMQGIAEAVDAVAALYGQGTLANRPVSTAGSPGVQGRFYYATDTGLVYYDHGTGWVVVRGTSLIGLLGDRPVANTLPSSSRYFATDQLVDYISDGANWIRTSDPAGVTASWYKPDAVAPTGWVKYDGNNLPSAGGIYADLYAHLGNTLTTPDTRGRGEVGLGTHVDVNAIGDNEGLAVGSRRPKHKHTVVQPTINVNNPATFYTTRATGASPRPSTTPFNANEETPIVTATATGGTVGPQTGSEPIDSAAWITTLKIAKL